MPKNKEQSTKHWWWFGSGKKEVPAEINTKSPGPAKSSHEVKRMSEAEFEAYEKSFQSCKKRVKDSKDTVVAGGSLSWDSIKDFTKSVCDIDEVVVGYIQKLKVNIFESKPVRSLIDDYFRVSLQAIELLSELENCLRNAGNSHLPLRLAAKKFDNKKFGEMVEKVGDFKASGDPFKERFWVLYVKLCDQQISLFDKVMQIHVLLNKPLPPKPKVMAMAKNKGCQETIVAIDEQQQDDDDSFPTNESQKEEEEEELKICAVVTEFENFRAFSLSWTEKITSLSESADFAMEGEAAKLVVDELNTGLSRIQDDISNMMGHTRECKNAMNSGRDKVLGLIKTSA